MSESVDIVIEPVIQIYAVLSGRYCCRPACLGVDDHWQDPSFRSETPCRSPEGCEVWSRLRVFFNLCRDVEVGAPSNCPVLRLRLSLLSPRKTTWIFSAPASDSDMTAPAYASTCAQLMLPD